MKIPAAIKRVIKDCLDFFAIKKIWSKNYYGETGEDALLLNYLNCEKKHKGFYVDIGAYHPARASNTYLFYKKGWRGINIDANPHSIKLFDKMRKRDINVNAGISDESGTLDYYSFEKGDSSNTFDKELYETWNKTNGKKADITKVEMRKINDILEKYLPQGQHIDFITIDVEGFEMKILKSFDYGKYSPDYFLVEDLSYYDKNKDFMEFCKSPLCSLLKEKGYIVAAKTWYSILFKKKQ
jgi:FkbM family methyltransferase